MISESSAGIEKPQAETLQVEHMSLETHSDELADGQVAYETSLSFWETAKTFWRCTLWILYGQLVVFGYGIDGIIAAYILAIPQFRQDYGEKFGDYYIIPAYWISCYSAVSQLTAIIGALGCGYLADKIGRRYTNLLGCVVSVGGVAAQYFSNGSLGVLTAGKALNGFPIGMWLVIGPLYASEVAPLKLRGWLTAITNIVQFSGVLLFTGVVTVLGPKPDSSSYLVPFACQWIIPCIIIPTIWFWPESPVWLARCKKPDAALAALDKLHGKNSSINKGAILAQIRRTIAVEDAQHAQESSSYLECFKGSDRRRTLICMFIYGCQYFSGLVFVLGYQTYFYQLVGFSAQKSFNFTMINNGLQFFANICSWFVITAIGRRPLLVWGQGICAVCLFIIGGTAIPNTVPANLATISFMFVWAFVYQLSLGPVAWTIVAEIPSLRLRTRTQGLANGVLCFTQWLIAFIFPYMFNPDAGNLLGKVGFVFGAVTFLAFLGSVFFVPETKNRTAEQLDELFEKRVTAFRFKETTTSVEKTVPTV